MKKAADVAIELDEMLKEIKLLAKLHDLEGLHLEHALEGVENLWQDLDELENP